MQAKSEGREKSESDRNLNNNSNVFSPSESLVAAISPTLPVVAWLVSDLR